MERKGKQRKDWQKNPETVKDQKAYIRKQMMEKRAGLSKDYCLAADERILERLLELECYRKAEAIFVYVSMKEETDTRGLILKALAEGKKVAVPRCIAKGIMRAYCIRDAEDLTEGAYGILEPGKECEEINPKELDLAVVPCICCSQEGIRMGYGGGYYDRYLPGSGAFRAALCREQLLVKDIPAEQHDCPMDFVVTEERVLEIGRK